jgi:hypothetical protein
MTAEESVLKRLQLDCELPDTGCCGMAGAFGFEKDHYDVSIACGERVLLPQVRSAAPTTVVVADGFSCREQISQTTGRKALHLAQVLELARRAQKEKLTLEYPEEDFWPKEKPAPTKIEAGLALAGVMAAFGFGAWWLFGRSRSEADRRRLRSPVHVKNPKRRAETALR